MNKVAIIKDKLNFWEVYKKELERLDINVELFDIYKIEDQNKLLAGNWDGFIFRAGHDPWIKMLGKRFLYLFDISCSVKSFPSWNDYWHYDDKISQYYLFAKNNIPTPNTKIFYSKDEALKYIKDVEFPIIYKASSGAGSKNVGLLKNKLSAEIYIRKAFGNGIKTAFKADKQFYYVYFQEFLKNNDGDYRIICLGDKRIFGFYRENMPNAKFARGSGMINYSEIPNDILTIVYDAHKKLNSPVWMSYDIMKDNDDNWVIGEISVINGNRDSIDIYKQCKHYIIKSEKFIETESTIDIQQYFINNLLKEWGWND